MKTKYISKGTALIAKERLRQITKEGWTPEHDLEEHDDGSLATAAACYALPYEIRTQRVFGEPLWRSLWPWNCSWYRGASPRNRLKDLVRAGALIVAEIDRLENQAATGKEHSPEQVDSMEVSHEINPLSTLVSLLENRVGTPSTGYYGAVRIDKELIVLVNSARSELKKLLVFKERMDWLHTGSERDSEGYEWGVARVKFDQHGQVVGALWTNSDHSDLDQEMGREADNRDATGKDQAIKCPGCGKLVTTFQAFIETGKELVCYCCYTCAFPGGKTRPCCECQDAMGKEGEKV